MVAQVGADVLILSLTCGSAAVVLGRRGWAEAEECPGNRLRVAHCGPLCPIRARLLSPAEATILC